MDTNQNIDQDQFEAQRLHVLDFLERNGIDPKKLVNQQSLFLMGIYNGMVISNNMHNSGIPQDLINKDVNIVAKYVNARMSKAKKIADSITL